ncbi:D-serine ammonia-lyase [Bacillus sp. USDA818B3_A]|uniref:D-serine ammonia-lyase n=1 Tax=Bacillus sp. USDA818B3_A TaxID=2698834 RepID=UPI00136B5A00|nr:D-serine ammonia-lyase [Bacillus sp. USDA818B3_A]
MNPLTNESSLDAEALDLLAKMKALDEVFWLNPRLQQGQKGLGTAPLTLNDIKDAEERLSRFAPYIARVFPETKAADGKIESNLVKITKMKDNLMKNYGQPFPGDLWLKCDSHLPISGSIKARGGIYEILKHAEDLAIEQKILTKKDDYSILGNEEFRRFFSKYSIAVGSTGNLGLSIGIISAKLGFRVTVHMSADAKKWKKDLLRSKGVQVVEYTGDYSKAVEAGRIQAGKDPFCYFVDDENSQQLFLGYAVAALRLKNQLEELEIQVDEDHPLMVYLPCGVGGAPGGVTFGLKQIFQDNVHCFFAEPTHSPCMLLGLMTGLHEKISVLDIGIDNLTAADGLAVGRPSGFVSKIVEPLLSGAYTIKDGELFKLLKDLADTENIKLEPSALAGMIGPVKLWLQSSQFVQRYQMQEKKPVHIVWATGGSMVPDEIMEQYYKKGDSFLKK